MLLSPHQAQYLAYKLTNRQPADSVEKLANTMLDAQVDLNPHQVDAALFAFRSPLSKGAILADEVGLGKTIEAGLVIAQKWAERKRRILVIVPANLRKQWSLELQEKFFLPSIIMEKKSFEGIVDSGNLNPFVQDRIIICSYPFAVKKAPYLNQTNWDLVVIDEAHRLRNVYRSDNKTGKKIKEALNDKPKVLLTATPLQNSIQELYGLVSIIDDYAFGDLKSFRAQYGRLGEQEDSHLYQELKQRLAPLCKRTLRKHVAGQIKFTRRIPVLEEYFPNEDEKELYDLVSEYLRRDNLFALPASQRSLMTMILRKLLASSTFAISGTFAGLSNKLNDLAKEAENTEFPDFPEGLSENFEPLESIADEWIDEEDEGEERRVVLKRVVTKEDVEDIRREQQDLRRFEELASRILINSKGTKLLTALQRGFDAAGKARRKAIIFTESVRTQAYIKRILEENGYRDQIVLFNGSNSDQDSKAIYQSWLARHAGSDVITGSKTADIRAALVEHFRDHATIMIATEAAAEGINLQFCSIVVNYDMPWNPQRIEQRIGRCHRYGQEFDVVVVNFLNKSNEADVRVYELLDQKFKLFNGVFGVSDEVLGSIESGVDFEKRIARIYQECRTREEIDRAFEELRSELDSQISRDLLMSRQKLLDNFDQEVLDKVRVDTGNYLGLHQRWLWDFTRYALRDAAEFDDEHHAFLLRKNPFPELTINEGPYRVIKRNDSGREIDPNEINTWRPGHPLAERLLNDYRDKQLPVSSVVFDYSGSPGKRAVLEPLIGCGGWLTCWYLCLDSFEREEHLVLQGLTDSGQELDGELCEALLSLPSQNDVERVEPDHSLMAVLNERAKVQKARIETESMNRNAHYFEQEMDKLERWSDDRKKSLDQELRGLDIEIRRIKAEARNRLDLKGKIEMQRRAKELESQRNELRRNLFQAQDDVDSQKEDLLDRVQSRLEQHVKFTQVFNIQWIVK